MKKALLAFVLLLVAGVAVALDGAVTWMWYSNDPYVRFYRYQLDGQDPDNWVVVDSSVEEVTLEVNLSVEHVLYLQQSYNGETWSVSSEAFSDVFADEEETAEDDSLSEEFIEEPLEEEIPEEGIPSEPEIAAVPEFVFKPNFVLDAGVSYADSIPHEDGPRTLGASVSVSYNCVDLEIARFGPKLTAGVFSTKNIVFNRSDIRMDFILDAMGSVSAEIAGSDVFVSFGLEADIQVGSLSCVRFGGVAELGFRYHCAEKFAIGLVACDHYAVFPTDNMTNNFELRAICSFDF